MGIYDVLLGFITSFIITFFAIPSIINVAKVKHLFDEPGERSSHSSRIPTLGGFAIFAGLLFSATMWIPFSVMGKLQYILCAMIVLFMIGAKDDIMDLKWSKKILGQFGAAIILVFFADIRLTSFYGILGIYEQAPTFVYYSISIFTFIVLINAVNLIDGINGLSGTIGSIICASFGTWFYLAGHVEMAILAATVTGALLAFLNYNITPARIFMGDTGSLLIGMMCAIFAIEFIELDKAHIAADSRWAIYSVPAVAIGVMIVPMFDTLRVFSMRMAKGKSPFSPDRTHIHHMLLDLGLSHMQGTMVLGMVNILFILLVLWLQNIGALLLLTIEFGLALLLVSLLHMALQRKRQKDDSLEHAPPGSKFIPEGSLKPENA